VTLTEPPVAEEQHPEPAKGKARITPLGKLVIFLVLLLVPLGLVGGYVMKVSSGATGTGEEVAVVIAPGASASTIATQLEKAGVIRAAWVYRWYARVKGTAKNLRAGEYVFRKGMSYAEVTAILEKGPKIEIERVTIPEGKTVREIARIVEKGMGIPAAEFLAEATNGKHTAPGLPAGSRNLEGFLFPKTYDFKKDATAADVVQKLLDQYAQETATADWSKAPALGLTRYQLMIVASMIEREAKLQKDRPKIARVIYNRLERHMRLQIDATVQYALFLKTGAYKTRVLFEDLEIDSPFNTYKIGGLPPAPIASPGLASIQAALNPEPGKWLYYVLINANGEHGFAETSAEFERLKSRRP
jgi:UPF0755 protein